MHRRDVLDAARLGVVATLLPAAAAHASDTVITSTGGAPSVRSYLSDAGKDAHDAVAAGDLFAVSSDDYAAVIAGLAAGHTVTVVGLSDTLMAERGHAWDERYPSRVATALWPAGAVLVGGRFGVLGKVVPITVLVGPGPSEGHVPVGAGAVPLQVGGTTPTEAYLLRRDPLAGAVERSLACLGASGATTTSVAFTYALGTVDGAWGPWIGETGRVGRQQYLLATPR